MAIIYNAKSKDGRAPELEFRYIIFKDGEMYYSSDRENIDLQGVEDWSRIPIVKRIMFNSNMGEGNYSLGLEVRDKHADVRYRTAFQSIDFEIRKDP